MKPTTSPLPDAAPATTGAQTIEQRIATLRDKHSLNRTQLFQEGRELILQGVKLANGSTGCTWKPERGESMHGALDEADQMLVERPPQSSPAPVADAATESDRQFAEAMIANHDPSVKRRARMEVAIIRSTIRALTAKGYTLQVDDGDGDELCMGNERALIKSIMGVDEARLITNKDGKGSFVFFVMGNDGHDVISDYGTSLETDLAEVNAYADRLCEGADIEPEPSFAVPATAAQPAHTPSDRIPASSATLWGSQPGDKAIGGTGLASVTHGACESCGKLGPWQPHGQYDSLCPECGGVAPLTTTAETHAARCWDAIGTLRAELGEAAEGCSPAEAVAILVSQRDNARNASASHEAEAAKLRTALEELVYGAEAMDKRLLELTGSPRDCERGDITRAKAALAHKEGN